MRYDKNKSFINLTYRCNNNCISCIMENHYQDDSDLTFNNIKNKIQRILRYSKHIGFNGGEPTLHKDIFKILSFANLIKKDVEIGLLTNARMFAYERNVKNLLKLNNFKIITTIYGHNSRLHNTITRTPNSFEQQIKGIKNLIKHKINIELRIVVHKYNFTQLCKIANYLIKNFKQNDFLYIDFVNAKLIGQAYKNKIGVETTKIIPNLSKAFKILKKANFNIRLFHFPHCILPKKLWKYSVGVSAEKTEVVFLPRCMNCSQQNQCSGVWKSYVKIFGDNEF